MAFPNYPDKYGGEAVMRPADTLDVRRQFGRFPRIEAPQSLIFCMRNGLPRHMRWSVPVRRVGRVLGDFYLLRRSRGRAAVLSDFGIGAPTIVSLAEEMIAFGVKRFVLLSWGGALQTDLQLGEIVVCDRAIRDEGVSHHYLPAERYALADPLLTKSLQAALRARGVRCRVGATWTTDAPYRETVQEVRQYQAEGVQTVEMETAALFALAAVREVQAASIVIASDSLATLTWEKPADMKTIQSSFEVAYTAAAALLSE